MKDDDVAAGDPIDAWLAATGGMAVPEAGDEEQEPRPRHKPSLRLLVLAAVPWIAVVLLGAAALQRPQSTGTAPAPVEAPSDVPSASASPPAARGNVENPAAAAAAVVAARLSFSGDEYLDTAAVEATHRTEGLTIVTLRAIRLLRTADTWSDPQEIRLGVGVAEVDGAAVVIAPPWRLPSASAPSPPAWTPVEDDQLLEVAREAIGQAGYADITKAALRRSEAVADVLSLVVTAVAPGDGEPRRHEILLSTDATAVLGASAVQMPALPIPAEQ